MTLKQQPFLPVLYKHNFSNEYFLISIQLAGDYYVSNLHFRRIPYHCCSSASKSSIQQHKKAWANINVYLKKV
jgi:hypothetical protein